MSLRGYKPKHRKAPWLEAFPEQASGHLGAGAQQALIKRIRPVSKRNAQAKAEYRRVAREFVAAAVSRGETCPVVAAIPELRDGHKYGHPISARLNEVHHTRGRTGALLLDQRYWMAISKQGHRWIHEHPALAREHGWIGPWGLREPLPGEKGLYSNL